MSKKSREAIRKVLSKHYAKVEITIVNNLSDLDALVAKEPDLAFLGMKFVPVDPELGFADSERIWLSEYLIEHGIVCTGSSSRAHRLDLNKPLAKQYVLDAGLATSAYSVATANQQVLEGQMPQTYPLFVKPTDRGGGAGIDSNSVVYDFEQLKAKVNSITEKLGSDSLIEQYLSGREFSVAIIKNSNNADYSIMPLELVAPIDGHGSRLLSKKIKSSDSEQAVAVSDKNISTAICDLAINVFHALGARDYGRVDIRLDQQGIPNFLEANLIPSLIDNYGSFPKAWAMNKRMEYEEMLLAIAGLGLERSAEFRIVPKAIPIKITLNPLEAALEV